MKCIVNCNVGEFHHVYFDLDLRHFRYFELL